MKVGNINPFAFQGVTLVSRPDGTVAPKQDKINAQPISPAYVLNTSRISNTIPDYNVRTPQRYTKLGVTEFAGGLKLHSYRLANGHQISIVPMEGSPAIVKNYVNVGSMNETDDIKGISHFLEHMAFNGTTGENGYIKLKQGDSFKKIDKLGGWTNASTNYAVTDYVNSTPVLEEKDLEEQIKIISAMTEDLSLSADMIEKEKGPVCSEINMILDNPETILMDQTVRSVFNIKSSADELVGGSTSHIRNLTREDVKAYYDKYYTPDNMNLVITGDVDPDKVIELVSKHFRSTKVSNGKKYEEKLVPISNSVRKDFVTDKAKSTIAMLGFAGAPNNDSKAKIIYEIIREHLYSTEVGLEQDLKELNVYSGFGKEKISNNPYSPSLLYYTIDSSSENSERALRVVYDKFSKLKAPSEEKLDNIKEGLLQSFKDSVEYSGSVNNVIGNSILNNTTDYLINYEELLSSITSADVQKFIDNYLNLSKVALTVVHPEDGVKNIKQKYFDANISFKGKRLPINQDKLEELTLDNNFKLGFYETNNDNLSFIINFKHDVPKDINPAVSEVFSEILRSGTMFHKEYEFEKMQEENNLNVYTSVSPQRFVLAGNSNYANFNKTFDIAKELLYSPRINQEEVSKAVARIKDSIKRSDDTAHSLYVENEAKHNPLYFSREKMLKDLDNVTVEDVRKMHQYILNNSVGTIVMNAPEEKDVKPIAIKKFGELGNVSPYRHDIKDVYVENQTSQVITKEKPVSQADIMQTFKFEYNDSLKEKVMMQLLNTLLSSSSIGLFDVLREKEHLAYSVYSDVKRLGNCGELSCNILTTTDNKITGEKSFDNVQKSINGFNRQINALINSEYTEEDFESAKRILKAQLLRNEGTSSKLSSLQTALIEDKGLDLENKIYCEIDNITREDIKNFALKVFSNPPIYTIVASKDTLEANKNFLEVLRDS